jgi:hypothetical protein
VYGGTCAATAYAVFAWHRSLTVACVTRFAGNDLSAGSQLNAESRQRYAAFSKQPSASCFLKPVSRYPD